MAVNYHNIDFSYLAKEPSFRSDLSYLVPDIIVSQNDYYRFGDLFDVVYDDCVNIGELGIFEYAEIGNVSSSEDVSPILLDMEDQVGKLVILQLLLKFTKMIFLSQK